MAGVSRKFEWRKTGNSAPIAEVWSYPTGMVWCPMKLSGMALMKCAELQKELGCGSLKQLRILMTEEPEKAPHLWPWLRRRRECPERASEEELRELRLALTPLKPVERSRKNPRAYECAGCGGRKTFGSRRCRRCWRGSMKP